MGAINCRGSVNVLNFQYVGRCCFSPIMLNIFVITISFKPPVILTITFLMLLVNIYSLLWDWNKLKFVVLPKPQNYFDNNGGFSKRKIWTYLGVLFFLINILLRIVNMKNGN
jgi:hypothetical protein